MSFLDNSGDIILDAVLTDFGRQQLAKHRFRISHFSFGDEEIDYSTYNPNHPQGSAYYDLEILQTPILEAFTNNQSLMKSRLLTLSRNDILFLPIMKVNSKYASCKFDSVTKGFNLIADTTTFSGDNKFTAASETGILHGVTNEFASTTTHICIDQGIDSTEQGQTIATRMRTDLLEDKFDVKVDSRLLIIENFVGPGKATPVSQVIIDDDGIATYRLEKGLGDSSIIGPFDPDNVFVNERQRNQILAQNSAQLSANAEAHEMFAGPLGNVLRIVPRTTTALQTGETLFDELGSTATNFLFRTVSNGLATYKFIDTIINVTGRTTGFSLDIPIRIIKGTSFTDP